MFLLVNFFFKIFADEKRIPLYNLNEQPSGNNAYAWSRGHKKMHFEPGLYWVLSETALHTREYQSIPPP